MCLSALSSKHLCDWALSYIMTAPDTSQSFLVAHAGAWCKQSLPASPVPKVDLPILQPSHMQLALSSQTLTCPGTDLRENAEETNPQQTQGRESGCRSPGLGLRVHAHGCLDGGDVAGGALESRCSSCLNRCVGHLESLDDIVKTSSCRGSVLDISSRVQVLGGAEVEHKS